METEVIMVFERQERVIELLDILVSFNRQRLNEYYELSLGIQRNFGLNDYVDIHANLANKTRDMEEKKDDIYCLPDNELAILEQVLLQTARIVGINTSDIKSESNSEAIRNYFPVFDPHNPTGPYGLLAAFGLLDNESEGYRMILTHDGEQNIDVNRVEQFALGLFQIVGGIIGLVVFCTTSGFAMIVGIIGARNIIEGVFKCATAIMGIEFSGTLTEAVRIIGRTSGWNRDQTEKMARWVDVADSIISGFLNLKFTPRDIRKIIQASGLLTDGTSFAQSLYRALFGTTDANMHKPTDNKRRQMSIQERYDYYLNFDISWGPGARIEKSMMKANLLRDIEELLLELNPNDSDYLRTLEIMNRLLAE